MLDFLSLPGYLRSSDDKIKLLLSYLHKGGTVYDIESFDDFKPVFNFYLEKLRGFFRSRSSKTALLPHGI